MTTATTTTTSQINDLIGWMRKNNPAAHVARFLVHFLTKSAGQREIFIFEVLTKTEAFSIPFLYVKTIRTKKTEVHFACFVKRYKHGIIVKTLNLTKSSILTSRFHCSNRRSFLNLVLWMMLAIRWKAHWWAIARQIPGSPIHYMGRKCPKQL